MEFNIEPVHGIPRIFEDSDVDNAYMDSLDWGDSEYDLDYKYNDEECDNDITITQNEIFWLKLWEMKNNILQIG
jgi:hypothetical protein